jgi:two-component system, chemotaxis family, sensor kinase CheA
VAAIVASLGMRRETTPPIPPKTPVVPSRPLTSAPTREAAPTPSAPAGLVRVASARLDALLMRAEEMVTAKLTGDHRVAALRALGERGVVWKKEMDRVRPDLATLRRFIDSGTASPVAKELKSLVHYLDWKHEYLREMQGDISRLAKTASIDQRRLGTMIEHLLQETKEVLMQPFAALLEIFPPFVREIALQQGKAIELEIVGAKTEIDRRVLEEIKDALVHLVRNCVDHGIEPAAERGALGKSRTGRLVIAVQEKSGGNVEIVISDDGRGIDAKLVSATARRLKLIAADAAELSDNDALALLFSSGFSTKSAATALSGRGLGLAIVREKAEQIGGTVSVESIQGRGTTFRLLLPITLQRFRGVFVTAQQQPFVVPAPYVRRVLRLRETDVQRVKHQDVIEHGGAPVVLLRLTEVLGLEAERKGAADGPVFVLLVESARSRIALRVDSVPHEQEIVMKSLGQMLRRASHYVGATIVGEGQIVPVLNVSHLLGATVRRATAGPGRSAIRTADRRKRTILVVEDSITSRLLLKNILQTAGFEVRTAVDGMEALTTLRFEQVDLVISDVQMPRLDGFELTAKIRADKSLAALPVILITSLASREDKARGGEAGANAYIVKTSFDQGDLLDAIRRFLP